MVKPSGWHRAKPRRETSTQRGYGYAHAQARKAALAAMPDGQRCFRCGRPMHRGDDLQYDHVTPIALGGRDGPKALSHKACNLHHGAVLGGKMARLKTVFRTSRQW